ncbi:hypothetical protein TRIUR3_32313 [Triticum urartu]|uniref:Uncharacterized protein n=1 Tax=Triticum urartu TaxID=4572 RepID=M7Y7K6_TRIUA|nr:hypothetical protein TRIUR3_32313 [Triticum urartu]
MDLIPASSQMSFWGDWNKGGGELEEFLPPPPEELTVGRDEVTVRDVGTYRGKCREGSILRRRQLFCIGPILNSLSSVTLGGIESD